MIKFILPLLAIHLNIYPQHSITYTMSSNLGDQIANMSFAKLISTEYNLKFEYQPFNNSEWFTFHYDNDNLFDKKLFTKDIFVRCDDDIIKNINNSDKTLFSVYHVSRFNFSKNSTKILKDFIKFKKNPSVYSLPDNKLVLVAHIRKGVGGLYEKGVLTSKQIYDFDRSIISYTHHNESHPFEYFNYKGFDYDRQQSTKYPPEQYYIDQIVKISNELKNPPMFVQIITDDPSPLSLVKRIKNHVNKDNISFHYEDNHHKSFNDRKKEDLYMMTRGDGLIRAQSNYARIAQLIGSHKFVIFPINCKWQEDKLIMTKIGIRGVIS